MSYFETLTLNSKTYSKGELTQLTQEKLGSQNVMQYEKCLYLFIQEWVSSSKVIKVNTSGTTGEPKEIIFQKAQAISSARMTIDYFKLNRNTNALLCLSTEFIGGKMMVVRAFINGMNLITIEPSGNPMEGVNERIDFSSMVPLQVQNSLQNEETKKKFLTIPNVIIGGASVSPVLEKEIAECSNNVYSTFGMTETLSHIALRRLSGKGRKDYYEILPGVAISADEQGRLVVNAPALNEKVIVTNDVVEIISSNKFRWLGRYDNVINSGGIKIHPEMVETKLATFLTNNRFFITSLPDEKLGQKLIMVVECPEKMDMSQIVSRATKTLSKYEIPKEYYRTGNFIETDSGKIKKEETLKISKKF
jgi:o-succinylbenzoate---CoA ligase